MMMMMMEDYPVAYFSRKLLLSEQRYSTVEEECLGVKLGVQAFWTYLLGRQFVIETDHRALTRYRITTQD